MAAAAPPEDLLARIAAGRGYLRPHHRLLAAHAPHALVAYDALYRALTLEPGALSAAEREVVWLALLAAHRKFSWRIHAGRGRAAGLDDETLAAALALGAHAAGAEVLDHGLAEWVAAVDPAQLARLRPAAFDTARGPVPPGLAHLALAACHATLGTQAGVRRHVPAALAHGCRPAQVAEGLACVLLECGVNALIEATATWVEAAAAGECAPPYPP